MKSLWTIALMACACLCSVSANATFVINVTEVGNSVVASGSGSINTAGLNPLGFNTSWSQPQLQFDSLQLGSGGAAVYNGYTGPSTIGPGPDSLGAMTAIRTGDPVGLTLFNTIPRLYVPQNYVSGSALAGTSTFSNKSLATLGLAVGSYQFTWGSGINADSMTVNVSVPEPSSVLLLFASAAALMRRRSRSN